MNNDLSHIEFYFPKQVFRNKQELVDSIISLMEERGSLSYSGYANVNLLREGLLSHIGDGNIETYTEISDEKKKKIENTIQQTILKCNEKLSVPIKNFVFVHPYLTTADDAVFDGVMAVAVYSCVFHLFINIEQYTEKSLENTVAHELNHTIFYYYHYDDFNNLTLLDEILLEGLAENFREQYFSPNKTHWARALSEAEAHNLLKESENILGSRDPKLIKGFLFGNQDYKKWSGYSLGYWLVKKFIEKHPLISWEDLMKIKGRLFLDM